MEEEKQKIVLKGNSGLVEVKKSKSKPEVKTEVKAEDNSEIMSILQSVSQGIGAINDRLNGIESRVDDMETNGANRFKKDARVEDIAQASSVRQGLDPKISAIVDEMLGVDFGAKVTALGDRPGFRFTITVPERLSDNVVDKRPVLDESGQYKKDSIGNVVFEDYVPKDNRSRILSSSDSYDAIKNHCEKVRGYIVTYFQKTSKPLPEFKVR